MFEKLPELLCLDRFGIGIFYLCHS
jgi:hypothetical protein